MSIEELECMFSKSSYENKIYIEGYYPYASSDACGGDCECACSSWDFTINSTNSECACLQ